jgi:hypothetical protein
MAEVPVGLRAALALLEELTYGGAHPLSSDAWLDLETRSVFCPLAGRQGLGDAAVRALRYSPHTGFEGAIACPPFSNDHKIPQDLARMGSLWYLVAADHVLGCTLSAESRQERFADNLEGFFASARSPRHAFWSCPMDTGIGATNLLFASEYFIQLNSSSAPAVRIRGLRDHFGSMAEEFLSLIEERSPTLNNNHHLMNCVSRTLLTCLGDDAAKLDLDLRVLAEEIPRHFDKDGFLAEGSTWYHAFVHQALNFALGVLQAYHPGNPSVAALAAMIGVVKPVPGGLIAGRELLLIGDADGSTYGPCIVAGVEEGPGAWRLNLVRRFPSAEEGGSVVWAERGGVALRLWAAEPEALVAPASLEPSWTWDVKERTRAGLRLITWRLHPAVASPPQRPEAEHLSGFGLILVSLGPVKVVIRTLPDMSRGALGHYHQDVGAVYVAVGDRWLSTDPGVVTYTGDLSLRARLRGATAHPTLIPAINQAAQPTGPFSASQSHLQERIVWGESCWRISHSVGADSYYLLVRTTRAGGLVMRRWTRSSRCNVPELAPEPSSYGYRIR